MTALVQSKSATGASVSTLSLTLDAPPTAGNLLVAGVGYNLGNAPSVRPFGASAADVGASADTTARLYSVVAASGQSSTVTVTMPATVGSLKLRVWEVSPTAGRAWVGLDQTTSDDTSAASVATLSTGTTATQAASDNFAVTMLNLNGTVGASGASNSFTVTTLGNNSLAGYKILSTTAAAETTYTWTGNRRGAAVLATYKSTPTATAPDANAGADAVREPWVSFVLEGSGSGGDISTTAWTHTSGGTGTVEIDDPDQLSTTARVLPSQVLEETYTFGLALTGPGGSDSDSVVITVPASTEYGPVDGVDVPMRFLV